MILLIEMIDTVISLKILSDNFRNLDPKDYLRSQIDVRKWF